MDDDLIEQLDLRPDQWRKLANLFEVTANLAECKNKKQAWYHPLVECREVPACVTKAARIARQIGLDLFTFQPPLNVMGNDAKICVRDQMHTINFCQTNPLIIKDILFWLPQA